MWELLTIFLLLGAIVGYAIGYGAGHNKGVQDERAWRNRLGR